MNPFQSEGYSQQATLQRQSHSTHNLKVEKLRCQVARYTGGTCIYSRALAGLKHKASCGEAMGWGCGRKGKNLKKMKINMG
jgi:hypothetical protein